MRKVQPPRHCWFCLCLLSVFHWMSEQQLYRCLTDVSWCPAEGHVTVRWRCLPSQRRQMRRLNFGCLQGGVNVMTRRSLTVCQNLTSQEQMGSGSDPLLLLVFVVGVCVSSSPALSFHCVCFCLSFSFHFCCFDFYFLFYFDVSLQLRFF